MASKLSLDPEEIKGVEQEDLKSTLVEKSELYNPCMISSNERTSITVKLYSGCPKSGRLSLMSDTSTTNWYSLNNRIFINRGKKYGTKQPMN